MRNTLLNIALVITLLSCSNDEPSPTRLINSIELDGLDDYIIFGDVAEYNQISISAWIKTSVSNTRIVSKTDAIQQYLLKISTDGKLQFVITLNGVGMVIAESVSTITDNAWH